MKPYNIFLGLAYTLATAVTIITIIIIVQGVEYIIVGKCTTDIECREMYHVRD